MKQINFLVSFILFYSLLNGQIRPINFYKITNNEGLSQASVNVMYKDKEGFLWIGTDDGLNRFDGNKIKSYYHRFRESNSMAANEVYGICEDQFRRLWIAHYNVGISIFDKTTNNFTRFNNNTKSSTRLSSNRVYGIYSDKKGFIWVRTDYGISKINPENFAVENFDYSIFSITNVRNVDIAEFDGYIWFGSQTKGLLRVTKNGKLVQLPDWNVKKHGASVIGMCSNDQQQLLVTSEKGLFKLLNTGKRLVIEPILEDSILFASAGKLFKEKNTPFVWIATDVGILVINVIKKKLFRHIKSTTINDNLISNVVSCLFQDEEQSIFIGTDKGVNVYSAFNSIFGNYDNVLRKIPAFGHPIYAIHELKNNDLLLGAKNGGIYYFNADSLQVIPVPVSFKTDKAVKVYHFTPVNKRMYLICTNEGLLELQIDKGQFEVHLPEKFPELQQLTQVAISDLIFANDSIAYIASGSEGFYEWNYITSSIKQYQKNDRIPSKGPIHNQVQNLVLSKENDVILCTEFGFSIYYPATDSFFNVSPGQKFPYELVEGNIIDAWDDGMFIWLATFGAGVQKFNKQTHLFTEITMQKGLPSNSVYATVPDRHGRIWIPTNRGLAVLDLQTSAIKTYTKNDGLPDNEFNPYASYKAPSGDLYFSTLNSIVKAKPELVVSNPYPPKIVLTHLEFKSEKNDWVMNVFGKSEVSVPAGYNSLYFEFASLSFAAPGQNKYKIMLENYDKNWLNIDHKTSWRYTKIPPGNYRLKIAGSNNSDVWCKSPFLINIYIAPFWFETFWYKLGLVLIAASAVYFVYRYRISQILKMEALRRKLSSDLHDDIGSTLSSINIYSELAKIDRDNLDHINAIQQNTRNIIDNLDDLVWSINPKNDKALLLLERMKSFALPLLSAKKIDCFFNTNINQETLPLTPHQTRNLFIAFKEMINNAIKYSNCHSCTIHLVKNGKLLSIGVEDDGDGFDTKNLNDDGNGLRNLALRAIELKGKFTVKSTCGKGTSVYIEIKI